MYHLPFLAAVPAYQSADLYPNWGSLLQLEPFALADLPDEGRMKPGLQGSASVFASAESSFHAVRALRVPQPRQGFVLRGPPTLPRYFISSLQENFRRSMYPFAYSQSSTE